MQLFSVIFSLAINRRARKRARSTRNMMTGAATKTSTATKSAAGGAGGLFSCFDFYSRFEGLAKVHARMVGAGATLNKAVRSALRETVVGSNSNSRNSLLADVAELVKNQRLLL